MVGVCVVCCVLGRLGRDEPYYVPMTPCHLSRHKRAFTRLEHDGGGAEPGEDAHGQRTQLAQHLTLYFYVCMCAWGF